MTTEGSSLKPFMVDILMLNEMLAARYRLMIAKKMYMELFSTKFLI